MTLAEALILGVATLSVAGLRAWWVLRPFERHRRELKRAREHAAE
jgi:hypothetical protein